MIRTTATAMAALLFSGCATFSNDGGFSPVAQLTRDRVGQTPRYQRSPADTDLALARSAELLQQPLSVDAAVELALLNNRGLQASFAELGIAEADRVRAGRWRNPSFTFGRLRGAGATEIDRAVVFDVLALLTLPLAAQAEQGRLEATQLQAAQDAVGVVAEARRAYFNAVAAQQLSGYAQQVKDAADTSNELALRMLRAGNFSKLTQMREQAFYADATAQLARATHQALAEREALVRVLGLHGAQRDFKLPERLPDLPVALLAPQDVEQTAVDQRLDVMAAKRATQALADALGLTQRTRFINVLHAGYQNKSATGERLAQGYEIELELPLFDFGTARVARAEASYLQALHHTADVGLNAQSEVREAYSAYRTGFELARHYRDEVVPLSKRISDENLLRYNGMLSSVFELLADARSQINSVTGAIEALRDFWVADTRLQTAMTGRSPGGSVLPRPSNTGATASAADAAH